LKKLLKVIALLVSIIVLLLLGGYFFIKIKLNKINYVEIPKEQIEITEGVSEYLNEYRNIVLLGLDTREDNYTGSRSDCIIIVSINETTKEVKLASVYRDSYLNIEGYGLDKVTHAYAYGGPALTMSTLNKNLDLDITEFAAVNFDATKDIIDEIGGITLTIDQDEVSHISRNKYSRYI